MSRRNRTISDKQGNVYFITTTVKDFLKIFSLNETYPLILLNSLKHQLKEHGATLFAYVIMPNHIHLVIYLPKNESVSDFMRDFKKYTSTKVRQQLEHDNYTKLVEALRIDSNGKKPRVFQLWMDRFDDLIITSEKTLGIKINYIHNNSVKAGLVEKCEDWKFSSARNYTLDDHSLISVATSLEAREV
jgi:REP element-mobilizing transposase RayT